MAKLFRDIAEYFAAHSPGFGNRRYRPGATQKEIASEAVKELWLIAGCCSSASGVTHLLPPFAQPDEWAVKLQRAQDHLGQHQRAQELIDGGDHASAITVLDEAITNAKAALDGVDVLAARLMLSAERSPIAEGTTEQEVDIATGADFRSVRWYGTEYSFTSNQAPVVRLLLEHWQGKTPDVGDETLLSAVDPEAPPRRLDTLFRDHPAWGTMIVAGGTKGTHRLSPPET